MKTKWVFYVSEHFEHSNELKTHLYSIGTFKRTLQPLIQQLAIPIGVKKGKLCVVHRG